MLLCPNQHKNQIRYLLCVILLTAAVNLVLDARLKFIPTWENRTEPGVDREPRADAGHLSTAFHQLEEQLKESLDMNTKICYDFRSPEYKTIKYVASMDKGGALAKTEIKFKFKTSKESLVLAAEVNRRPSVNTRKDHLIVLLLGRRVYLLADAGQTPVSVFVERSAGFSDNQWHTVSITKDDYFLRAAVDLDVGDTAHACQKPLKSADDVPTSYELCNTTHLRKGSIEINTNSGLHLLSVEAPILDDVKAIARRTLGLGAGVQQVEKGGGCVKDVIIRGRRYFSSELVHMIRRAPGAEPARIAQESNATLDVSVENSSRPIMVSGQTFAEFRAEGNASLVPYLSLHRAPIVTGISENHYREAIDMIASSHHHMAKKIILVYNLGLSLHSVLQLKTLCWVKLRNIDLSLYPPHVRWLKACAWKPLIIQAALQEFKAVIYCDASTRFNAHMSSLIPLWQSVGILSRKTLGPASAYTHPLTYRSFDVAPSDFHKVSMAAAGVLLITGTAFVKQRILAPWVQCALRQQCIAPGGLVYTDCARGKNAYDYRGCQRFDQSALTVLLFKAFGNEKLAPAMTPLVSNMTLTVRHPTNQYQVKVCK
ncbi:uncharacterized protein LOC135825775 [Sycon ciliatum]|uniref:uncharacterized protein LOC135825775 n=1 Tax=Sycon ciliatum TaxID=27933 RepID=UPI0031F6D8AE